MRNFLFIFALLQSCFIFSLDRSLIILLDREKKEVVNSDEFNLTHQMMSMLSQKQSVMIVQKSLYKNYQYRAALFRKNKDKSVYADIVNLFGETNNALQALGSHYSVNQKLNRLWFDKKYSRLASMSDDDMKQLQFNFFCYHHVIDFSYWHKVPINSQLMMFIPRGWMPTASISGVEKCASVDFVIDKIMKHMKSNWYVYASGHGALQGGNQPGLIAGMTICEFKKFLQVLQKNRVKLLVYASCYAGGVHSVQPYENMKFEFPIIIFSLTDSQTYVFGNPAGVKLPPYGDGHMLIARDVQHKKLARVDMVDIKQLKHVAEQGQINLDVLRKLNPFYYCEKNGCFIEKVENIPLVRHVKSTRFIPCVHSHMSQMVDVIDEYKELSVVDKLLLVYAKLTHKISTNVSRVQPLVSMLPGKHAHRIKRFQAHEMGFLDLMQQLFFNIDDAHLQKTFLIDEVVCKDDVKGREYLAIFKNVMVLHEHMFMPDFVPQAQSIIFVEIDGCPYVVEFWNNRVHKIMQINKQQHEKMKNLYAFVKQSVDYGMSHERDLLDAYAFKKSELFHKKLIEQCKADSICF